MVGIRNVFFSYSQPPHIHASSGLAENARMCEVHGSRGIHEMPVLSPMCTANINQTDDPHTCMVTTVLVNSVWYYTMYYIHTSADIFCKIPWYPVEFHTFYYRQKNLHANIEI